MPRLAFLFGLLAAGFGCDSITPVQIVEADQRESVIAHHDVALDCTLVQSQSKPNLTFAETYVSSMPAYPKYGWKYDLGLQVNRAIKGDFEDSVLKLNAAHDVQDTRENHLRSSHESASQPSDAATMGSRWTRACVVAFDRGFFGDRTHWTFVRLPEGSGSR